ncbi:MAG: hypothetical protein COA78_08285 [Blastopirellula sp.]|nr:MAG: hypothetical protein COA78_08285 [Blastopirellula sp.]
MRSKISCFSRLTLIAVLLFTVSPQAHACLNHFFTKIDGHAHTDNSHYYLLETREDSTNWNEIYQNLKTELETEDNYKKRSDMAAAMIHLGQTQEAIDILVELEEKHPGEYTIAGNLGTAYELVGEVGLAIKWIKIGMERNPDSHDGSEWLHVRILEVKQELAADPDWLNSHSVLGLDFGQADKPKMPASFGEERTSEDVIEAIQYQLHERLQFVKGTDPIVADLLVTLGNLIALTDSVEPAVDVYKLAMPFPENLTLAQRRLDYFQQVVDSNALSGTRGAPVENLIKFGVFLLVTFVVICILTICGMWYLWRRYTRRRLKA